MATEPSQRARPTATVRRQVPLRRYNGRSRWLHAAVYLSVLILLATGWWLLLGREGDPSPLSRVSGVKDTTLHTWTGWALAALAGLALLVGVRGAITFTVESVRFRRQDLHWFRRWPRAIMSGRFGYHQGHFDPGQRVANIAMMLALLAVIVSGAGMALLHGGPAFVWLVQVHRWSTYLLTPFLLGHIVIASGILPGYRGAWRSMHLGGNIKPEDARRLWPGWLDRAERDGRTRR